MNDGRAPGAAVGAGAYPARAAILTRTATRVRNEERGAQTNNSYSGNRGKITAANGAWKRKCWRNTSRSAMPKRAG
jgi:hypothetical protein